MNLIYTSVPVHLTKDKISSDNNALSENALQSIFFLLKTLCIFLHVNKNAYYESVCWYACLQLMSY